MSDISDSTLDKEQLPSTSEEGYWIYARSSQGNYPAATERNGKWLIWLSPEKIDPYWLDIKHAIEQGQLGSTAKVSTAFARTRNLHVICVYTYDWTDEADVMRVREQLRVLGIQRPIIYKTDEDTKAGLYGADYTPKYRV